MKPHSEGTQLTTERLLAYRRRLLTLEDSLATSDQEPFEVAEREPGYAYFKDTPEWRQTAATAKAILDERPHVER